MFATLQQALQDLLAEMPTDVLSASRRAPCAVCKVPPDELPAVSAAYKDEMLAQEDHVDAAIECEASDDEVPEPERFCRGRVPHHRVRKVRAHRGHRGELQRAGRGLFGRGRRLAQRLQRGRPGVVPERGAEGERAVLWARRLLGSLRARLLSLHHGIHCTEASVVLNDLIIKDFDVMGIQCNGCHNVLIVDCDVGAQNVYIPVLGRYTQGEGRAAQAALSVTSETTADLIYFHVVDGLDFEDSEQWRDAHRTFVNPTDWLDGVRRKRHRAQRRGHGGDRHRTPRVRHREHLHQ